MHHLSGKKIAIVVDDGFEQVELVETRKALEEAGATTEIVSPQPEVVKACNHSDWGDKFHVDVTVERADAAKYDGLLLPGGVMNPDKLRHNSKVLQFVSSFAKSNKPIAAICHPPWTLNRCEPTSKTRVQTGWTNKSGG